MELKYTFITLKYSFQLASDKLVNNFNKGSVNKNVSIRDKLRTKKKNDN